MALWEPRNPHRRSSVVNTPQPSTRPVWRGYLLSSNERRLIDQLIGQALLDPEFCEQLVTHRTLRQLTEWGFTPETSVWLCSLEAATLNELAEAVTLP